MAKEFNRGDPIFIPFIEGKTVTDSQLMPRMYKTREAFQKYFPGGYVKRDSVELAEYNEVVRCKDCKHWHDETGWCYHHSHFVDSNGGFCHPWESTDWKMLNEDDFCSYGERKDND